MELDWSGKGLIKLSGDEIEEKKKNEGKKINELIIIKRDYGGEEIIESRIEDRGIENIKVEVVEGIGKGIIVKRGKMKVILERIGDNELEGLDIIGKIKNDEN